MKIQENRLAAYNKISGLKFFNRFKGGSFLGEFAIGSDVLGLATEDSDYDILFLYADDNFLKQSSFDAGSRHCSEFIRFGDAFVQWTTLSLLDIKKEIMKEGKAKDFLLLSSLVKFGIKGSEILALDKKKNKNALLLFERIDEYKRKIGIFAFYSFLICELRLGNGGLASSFESGHFGSACLVTPKFWYTAYLGHSLIFSSPYDDVLSKRLKDMKYEKVGDFSKEEEFLIVGRVKECCEYFLNKYSAGIDKFVEDLYNRIVSNNPEE